MRRTQYFCYLPIHQLIMLVALLATTSALAQRTVVQDAGGGRKLELHYNAEGKVAELRTIGPDGQLLQQQTLEYPAGSYVPNTTATSYWPNGKVHKVTRNTYDNSANFTGEFVQVFDESGKQTAGHRLVHDPQNNTYHCADWNVPKQDYVHVQCPAGEESSGTPETVKKFTQDEVNQQLAKAREAAQRSQTPVERTPAAAPLEIVPPKPTTTPPPGSNVKEMGFIFPAKIRPGDRVSGSVVDNPSDYESQPGITVTRIALPFAPSGAAADLAGWTLEISGEPPQFASRPFVLTIPPGQVGLAVLFHPTGDPSVQVSKIISLPNSPKPKRPTSYTAPAICVKGQLCVVRGPFSGDAGKTFAAFEQRPARIIAETLDSVYLAIPGRTEAGSRPLVVAEGSKAIAFPMVVAEFGLRPDARDVKQGELSLLYQSLDGPQELPDPLWLPGNYPATNLDEARQLIPGFQVPKANKEAKEQREKESKHEGEAKEKQAAEPDEDMGGEILLVIKNLTPDMVTLRDSQNGMYVFHLKASSFQMGQFMHKGVVEANKTGNFGVKGYVIPFLAPVPGQEFAITPAQ
ncbi:MAG: hypothetical protein WCC25_13230 [Candidatus Korobacteraceae bacterium]